MNDKSFLAFITDRPVRKRNVTRFKVKKIVIYYITSILKTTN